MPRLLQIALLGNPVLHTRASEVPDPKCHEIQSLIDDMIATMIEVDGVGVAAPQVYRSVRVFVMRSRKGPRFPDAPEISPFAVINPQVIYQSDMIIRGWESCFSMPGYRAMISRPRSIVARWQDQNGQFRDHELQDLAARVFLHELDHLDGKMFLDRMNSISDLVSEKEMLRHCMSELP